MEKGLSHQVTDQIMPSNETPLMVVILTVFYRGGLHKKTKCCNFKEF